MVAAILARAVHISSLGTSHSRQLRTLILIKSSNTTSPKLLTRCKLCQSGMESGASAAQRRSPSIKAWLATALPFTGKIRIRLSVGFTIRKSCLNSSKNRCYSWSKVQTLSRKRTWNWRQKLRYWKMKWVAKNVPSKSSSNRINSSRMHRRQIVGHWHL